jgi:signal transduction histidine kinase
MIEPAAPALERAAAVDPKAEISRASLQVRCDQAFSSFPTLTAVLVIVGLLLWTEAPPARLAGWLILTFLALCLRIAVCREVVRGLGTAVREELAARERKMFWSTVPLNLAMGSGMWWVATVSTQEIQFFVTLAICFYAIGALINLSSNAASFQLALALNLGQAILFWLMEGVDGMKIAVPLFVIAYLLVDLGRQNQRAFAKDILLIGQLDREKDAVEKALAEAEEASESKSAFLAAASHDLRQPLAALSLYAGSLSMQVAGASALELVRKLRGTISVLQTLFGNLLDRAQFDTGKMRPNFETFEIDEVFEDLDNAYRPLVGDKSMQLVIRGLPVAVTSDRVLLERLLGNLLHNAIKFTDTGSVELSAQVEKNHLRICIEDTGPGIASEDQERIFEEFQQLNNPGRRRERGFGLGLSIVRRIDHLLGLHLELESREGRGTRFTLRVPLARALGDNDERDDALFTAPP